VVGTVWGRPIEATGRTGGGRGTGSLLPPTMRIGGAIVNCADCGERIQSGFITRKHGWEIDLATAAELKNLGPIRCNTCLLETRSRLDAIVDRVGPLLLTSLWA